MWQLAERVPRTAPLNSGWTQHGPRGYVHVHCPRQAGRQRGEEGGQPSSPGSLVCSIVAAYINWALQLIWIRRGKRKTKANSRRKSAEEQTESRTGFAFNCWAAGQLLTYGNRCLYRLMPSHTRRMSYQASFAVPSRMRQLPKGRGMCLFILIKRR